MDAKAAILQALKDGQRLTVLNMIIRFHVTSGQQRVNELRREGHPIADEWTKLTTGKRIKTYYMVPAAGVPTPQGSDGFISALPPALDLRHD